MYTKDLIKFPVQGKCLIIYFPSAILLILSQATNEIVTRVPESTQEEMDSAVAAAKEAFPAWSNSTVLSRQQVMFKFQDLIKQNLVFFFKKSL